VKISGPLEVRDSSKPNKTGRSWRAMAAPAKVAAAPSTESDRWRACDRCPAGPRGTRRPSSRRECFISGWRHVDARRRLRRRTTTNTVGQVSYLSQSDGTSAAGRLIPQSGWLARPASQRFAGLRFRHCDRSPGNSCDTWNVTVWAVVTTTIRLRFDCDIRPPFDCSWTALRPFDIFVTIVGTAA